MWQELIRKIDETLIFDFHPPAESSTLTSAEQALQMTFPDDLRSFLTEMNGVYCPTLYLDVVWSTVEIVRLNLLMRQGEESLASLLFFADAGTDGVLFGFSMPEEADPPVVAWYPYENVHKVVASSLEDFLHGWLGGKFEV